MIDILKSCKLRTERLTGKGFQKFPICCLQGGYYTSLGALFLALLIPFQQS